MKSSRYGACAFKLNESNRQYSIVDILSIYFEMNYLKIYLEFFELEIISGFNTNVFTLSNKNKRITKLNENKNKLLDRKERRECSENYFLYNLTVFAKCFLSLISLYTTLFVVLGVINAPEILYNQSNPSYHSYTMTLII
jgi:hypothetical protein